MDANDIVKLLAAKHSDDCFVPECNTGSAMRGCSRFDAWVLKSTWSPTTTIGYEVKVSRSDFMRDEKWPQYLKACHQFYFVCPRKLVSRAEVPEGCGLIWAGKRLTTIVKAPRREPDQAALLKLMTYVLMSRTMIRRSAESRQGDIEYWRQWLERKTDSWDLGRSVSRRLHRNLLEAQEHEKAAKREVAKYESFREILRQNGIDPDADRWTNESKIRESIGVADALAPDSLRAALGTARYAIDRALQQAEQAADQAAELSEKMNRG